MKISTIILFQNITIKISFYFLVGIFPITTFSQSGVLNTKEKYQAGYKTILLSDYGRPISYQPTHPRVIPVHIWYPSKKTAEKPVPFIELVKDDTNFTWKDKNASQILLELAFLYDDSALAEHKANQLSTYMTSSRKNAKAVSKKFPVVILGSGINSPGFVFSTLAEFLAKNGYVVIAYPNLTETQTSHFSFTQRSLYNQLNDLEFVINELYNLQNADFKKLALVSWSFGGATQILYQMKYKSAKALVSLDAASQYEYGYNLISNSEFFDSTKFFTPFLQITASAKPKFDVARSSIFYETLCVNKTNIKYFEFNHSQLLSITHMLNENILIKSYYKMCDTIKLFLDKNVAN